MWSNGDHGSQTIFAGVSARFGRGGVRADGLGAGRFGGFAAADARSGKRGNPIPADFTGLSYETAQLGDPEFLFADEHGVGGLYPAAGTVRRAAHRRQHQRVLHWSPEMVKRRMPRRREAVREDAQANVLPQALAVGPDTGHGPAATKKITPQAVRNLRGFIDATGWKLIYGLNMGTESAETAAAEADYVMRTMGDKLIAFQLCNEPNLFYRNGLRKSDYNFAQFAQEWQHFYEVIRQKVPNAPFAGPDTAFSSDSGRGWQVREAVQKRGRVSVAPLLCGGPADGSFDDDRTAAESESEAGAGV